MGNEKNVLEFGLTLQDRPSSRVKEETGKLVQKYAEQIKKYDLEKTEIKMRAENFQRKYDDLNIRDDQFDMSEAMISLALAVLGIAALTRKKALVIFGLSMSALGILFGLAGFVAWNLHPEWLAQLLG